MKTFKTFDNFLNESKELIKFVPSLNKALKPIQYKLESNIKLIYPEVTRAELTA